MKFLLLAIMLLLNCAIGDAAELKLKRSNAVIANVWSAKDLAACGTTLVVFHAKCQLDRCTQKCPACPAWDVSFVPVVSVARKPMVGCELCSEKIAFNSGFAKADLH